MGKSLVTLQGVKTLMKQSEVEARFKNILGNKASSYMASVINLVSNNSGLQLCDPNSVLSAAFIAASFDLPVDPALGQACIVPYACKNGMRAQFQIQWKGYVQLAIRTGLYLKIYVTSIYEDEFDGIDIATGEIALKEGTQRRKALEDKIIGYLSWFKLKSGYEHTLYMTKEEVLLHAKKYSKAFQRDSEKKTKKSMWSTDFHLMGRKTLIKQNLSKWGPLSIELRDAFMADMKVYDKNGEGQFLDNPTVIEDTKTEEEDLEKNIKQEIIGAHTNIDEIKKIKENNINEADFWQAHGIDDPRILSPDDYNFFIEHWDEACEILKPSK